MSLALLPASRSETLMSEAPVTIWGRAAEATRCRSYSNGEKEPGSLTLRNIPALTAWLWSFEGSNYLSFVLSHCLLLRLNIIIIQTFKIITFDPYDNSGTSALSSRGRERLYHEPEAVYPTRAETKILAQAVRIPILCF